jgi:hypothetical protein
MVRIIKVRHEQLLTADEKEDLSRKLPTPSYRWSDSDRIYVEMSGNKAARQKQCFAEKKNMFLFPK